MYEEATGNSVFREWHNVEVGKGYKADHVIRQSGPSRDVGKVLDFRGPRATTPPAAAAHTSASAPSKRGGSNESDSDADEDSKHKSKKRRKDKDSKVGKKEKKDDEDRDSFKKSSKEKVRDRHKKDPKHDKYEKKSKSKKHHKDKDKDKDKVRYNEKSRRRHGDHKSASAPTTDALATAAWRFNPLLQLLATRISNTTREFTVKNGY